MAEDVGPSWSEGDASEKRKLRTWSPRAEGRGAVTPGDQLLTAIGAKQATSADTSEATQLRDRAYTHFMESYYEARRSLDYHLGDRDAVDEILPSIFNYKRSAKAEPAPVPAPVAGGSISGGVTPAPAPGGGGPPPAHDPDSPFVTLARASQGAPSRRPSAAGRQR